MPGNEVGDRIHNFFGHEIVSQGQQHQQVVDGAWPGMSNNPWVGNQGQLGFSQFSNLKSNNFQQSADSERGQGGQSSSQQHGLNLSQSFLRPESARNQSHSHVPTPNGYIHGHQVFQKRQNEGNVLGMDMEFDQHNQVSRGFSVRNSHLGSVPELNRTNYVRMDSTERMVNYDFFGGQQQMSSQHPGMLQSLSRQQPGINDVQFSQQQAVMKHMQELQMQQQHQKQHFQPQEVRQLNSENQLSSYMKKVAGSQSSPLINGIPIQGTANYSCQPEPMTSNKNQLQHVASPVMQGSSGLMFSPEQGQPPRSLGLFPQHPDQSLYGLPISGARVTSNRQSPSERDKSVMQQLPSNNSSFLGNQYNGQVDQVSMQDSSLLSKQGYQGQNMGGFTSHQDGQNLNSILNLQNLFQVGPQETNGTEQEIHNHGDLVGPSKISQEKMMMQVAPLRNAASLDPTEEKILFGSDDNIWDAFGRDTNMSSGGYSFLDGSDMFGAFPSMQSGSWSALMQSAVAEASNTESGLQEGCGFHSSEHPAENRQNLTLNDNCKYQSTLAGNSLPTISTLSSRTVPVSTAPNPSINYSNNLTGVAQSEKSSPISQLERLGSESAHKFIQHFPGNGINEQMDRNPLENVVESTHIHGKVGTLTDESNAKNQSFSWKDQPSSSLCNDGDQLSSKLNGWNFINHISPSLLFAKDQGNHHAPHAFENNDHKNSMLGAELEYAKSAVGRLPVNGEDSNLNGTATLRDSSTIRVNQERNQQLSGSGNIDIWRHVDSAPNSKGSKGPGNCRSSTVKSQKSCDSLGNNSSENAQLDACDSGTYPVGKHKSSNHIVRRKFQYHPMGDVDVEEEPQGSRYVASPLSQGLKGHDHGVKGHSSNPTHLRTNSVETEKVNHGLAGCFPGFQGDIRGSERIPSKSISSNSSISTSAQFDRSAGTYPYKSVPSSQNMLELLHKVDEAGEDADVAHFLSSDLNRSYDMTEEETSDGSVHFRQNQSSMPQGYGLQLAPPSQLSSIPCAHVTSGNPLQKMNSLGTTNDTPNIGVKGSTGQLLPHSRDISYGELRSCISLAHGQSSDDAQRTFSAVNSLGFSSRSNAKNQNMHDTSGWLSTSQSKNVPPDGCSLQARQPEYSERSQTNQPVVASSCNMPSNILHGDSTFSAEKPQRSSINQDYTRDGNQQFPVLEASAIPHHYSIPSTSLEVATSKFPDKVWTSASAQHHSYGTQAFKAASNVFKNNIPVINNTTLSSAQPQSLVDEKAQKDACVSKVSANCFDGKQEVARSTTTQGKEAVSHSAGASSLNPSSTQKEIEAFGRSLRPNNIMYQNYSLQQVQAQKNIEMDPDKRKSKEFKTPDGNLGCQHLALHGVKQAPGQNNATDASTSCSLSPSGNPNTLNFSARRTDDKSKNVPTQDTQNLASNAAISLREHPQVSPQMAPSWFGQFGTFKNGQIAPIGNPWKTTSIKPTEMPITVGKPSDTLSAQDLTKQGTSVAADASQNNIILNSLSRHASENSSEIKKLNPEAAITPKKRKSAEHVPWHEKVTHGSLGLEDISMAERNWARAANRLTEKVEEDSEMMEARPPFFRSKRRLVLSTQLMQLLLNPPPASVLSAHDKFHSEIVACHVARSILGDTCSTLSYSRSDAPMPSTDGNMHSKNVRACERIRDQYLSKVMDDLVHRAKKLENDLLRLDKGATLTDLRVECQELEKFSVINRFARFHARSQADGAESSLANSSAQRVTQQRYVTAVTMPKNLPVSDMVPCLSL